MDAVKRIYVEKKQAYAVKAKELLGEIRNYLGITTVSRVRIFIRYDIENITEEVYRQALGTVFYEPPLDRLYEESLEDEVTNKEMSRIFGIEFLPGQFDQRADSAMQCIKLLSEREEPVIRTAVTYLLEGKISDQELTAIKSYCMNPVDSRETDLDKPETLKNEYQMPGQVAVLQEFIEIDKTEEAGRERLREWYDSFGLAMTFADFLYVHQYFAEEEKRNPTITEIRVLDTYWSDHCRHTTFSTELKDITLEDGFYKKSMAETLSDYLDTRKVLYGDRADRYVCLMDLALVAMRRLKKEGKLNDLEESEEINACSIVVPVEMNGKTEEWIVSFKNETHNHPTEIEPFGGAATCLGGAIRDPLSGRTYVYQAMRVTGAADPTVPLKDTRKGKLPQKKLVRGAAEGYSSYGNQIGLATGYVKEIYHPSYAAKRMEIGAVIGAAKRENIVRKSSDPGDAVILLGGRTGRDGCGGATGSSKAHTESSIESCGAEVQKGNPPTERKIQRLFRREEVTRLIKKCNDFGAGGVSVAIGELADGLRIQLDKVPKKYEGLDGTEIAISESQERMAVVVAEEDVSAFLAYAGEENLEAVKVAKVTKAPRLIMIWNEKEIVNISRAFLNTNGAHQQAFVAVEMPDRNNSCLDRITDQKTLSYLNEGRVEAALKHTLRDLNTCSQKGLVEMFDSSIGSGSVLLPYGGKYQLTETQVMAAKLPALAGETDTVTLMSYGFDPYLSSWSPYHGSAYAVLQSVAKIAACGGDFRKIRFTFQEYFKRMSADPKSWGQPFSALLGAYHAQIGLSLAAIGGKDSMSGTFQELDVAPTLVSFAVDVASQQDIISPELKMPGNMLLLFEMKSDEYDMPDYRHGIKLYEVIYQLIRQKKIVSAYALDSKGIAAAVSKMAFGNQLGAAFNKDLEADFFFRPFFGSILAEIPSEAWTDVMKLAGETGLKEALTVIGTVNKEGLLQYRSMNLPVAEAAAVWKQTLEPVFPTKAERNTDELQTPLYACGNPHICRNKVARPTVFIPVFPGTNCEDDSMLAFKRAGAEVVTKVFRNLNGTDIRESVDAFAEAIKKSQIVMFPGGFSAGDEPEGAAKFFAAAFRNEKIKEAVHDLLQQRDGLVLGICNGFQALVKLGLLPYGEISLQKEDSPTLTYNTIGRHISKMVYTKVVSDKSPWLLKAQLGNTYVNPASHGEGRFVASAKWLESLFREGQVATQYVNPNGAASMDEEWNVNGSYQAVEGITSPDGRVFGKMVHVERYRPGLGINIYGEQDMKLFESGVEYFR